MLKLTWVLKTFLGISCTKPEIKRESQQKKSFLYSQTHSFFLANLPFSAFPLRPVTSLSLAYSACQLNSTSPLFLSTHLWFKYLKCFSCPLSPLLALLSIFVASNSHRSFVFQLAHLQNAGAEVGAECALGSVPMPRPGLATALACSVFLLCARSHS